MRRVIAGEARKLCPPLNDVAHGLGFQGFDGVGAADSAKNGAFFDPEACNQAPAATTQVDSIDGRSIGYSRRWRRVRKEGPPMKITIQVLIEGADALPLTVPTHTIDRLCERIEEVGLQTVEAKSILRGLEQNVVRHQLGEYLAGKRSCPHCQRSRAIKGYHPQ